MAQRLDHSCGDQKLAKVIERPNRQVGDTAQIQGAIAAEQQPIGYYEQNRAQPHAVSGKPAHPGRGCHSAECDGIDPDMPVPRD